MHGRLTGGTPRGSRSPSASCNIVALRPEEWKPICSSASRTVTIACDDSAAAADRPATPPPMISMSDAFATLGGWEPFIHDFTALSEPYRFHDLIIVGEFRAVLPLAPKGREEIVEVASEQRRRISGDAPREVGRADDRNTMLHDLLAWHRPLDVAPRIRGHVDDHAARAHRRNLRVADQARRGLARN